MSVIKLRNARCWKGTGYNPLLVCTSGFLLAFLLRYALGPVLDEAMSMLLFACNCIVMGYFFGCVYAIGLLVVSIPTALFFFRKPFLIMDGLGHQDVFLILVYGSIVMLASVLIEWLQRERYAAVLQQRVSETRYQMLIETDQARRAEYAEHFAAAAKRQAQQRAAGATVRPVVAGDAKTGDSAAS
jgi:K+-sensing histidine kinase KdpD